MSGKRYTDQHEWVEIVGDTGTVGISNHAQEQLGDIVYIELPEVGRSLADRDELAVVESVKAASEIYAPVAGEVIEVNEALNTQPDLVNASAEDEGWFVRLKVADAAEAEGLMDGDAYAEFLKSQE